MRQRFHTLRSGLAVAMLASLCSCGQTAGQEITFSTAVVGGSKSGDPTRFTTFDGWSVALSKALVLVGPIYFYEGAPQASLLRRLFSVRSAHACPTHAQYNKGTVLGEVLGQHVIDLLGGKPIATGEVAGVAGTCRSVELHLHPPGTVPGAPDTSALGGHTLRLAGTAEKGGKTVAFSDGVTIPDEGLMRIVESIPADARLDPGASGTLVLEVLLDEWLAALDFSILTDKKDDTYLLTEGSQAHTALLRGARSRYAYRLAWRAP